MELGRIDTRAAWRAEWHELALRSLLPLVALLLLLTTLWLGPYALPLLALAWWHALARCS